MKAGLQALASTLGPESEPDSRRIRPEGDPSRQFVSDGRFGEEIWARRQGSNEGRSEKG